MAGGDRLRWGGYSGVFVITDDWNNNFSTLPVCFRFATARHPAPGGELVSGECKQKTKDLTLVFLYVSFQS